MIKSLTFAVLMLCAQACTITNSPPPEPPVREPETPTLDEPAQPTVQGPAIPDENMQPPPGVLAGGGVAPDTKAPDTNAPDPKAGAACKTDSDCVPASCCHPTQCVAKGSAPSCADTMCTKECRGGTLDCGGSCLCQNGTCAAQFKNPSAM
jgi:hypothetical protein